MTLQVRELALSGVKIITPARHGDHRGFFSETWNQRGFAEAGVEMNFVQDNHSLSATPGTLRGLHFQTEPFAQDKLVRVTRGSIYDVAVDLRAGSPTYGEWVGAEISAANGDQILVPVGFAHGFVTLEPDTEVIYKVTNYYSPENDAGIIWNDPDIGIDWPVDPGNVVLSDKDQRLPRLADIDAPFTAKESSVA